MAWVTLTPHPYRYPPTVHVRRHRPAGYKDYRDYRPWLEDEFLFRCVYCLTRQKWARTDIWSVGHLMPQVDAPERECDYDNLVLTCQWCNSRKLADRVPNPCFVAYGKCLAVNDESGEVVPLNNDGRILERILKLNHPDQVRTRRDKLRDLTIIAKHAPEDWKSLMGFPEDLPNLRRKDPPGDNTRPEGIELCHYEQRRNGQLPEMYE